MPPAPIGWMISYGPRRAYSANTSIPNYDVSPDGQRLFMVKQPTEGRLHLVLNR